MELRLKIKKLVYDFMLKSENCSCDSPGMKQAEIFRACGLDWGLSKCNIFQSAVLDCGAAS